MRKRRGMIQRREKAEELHGWRERLVEGGYERGKKRGGWDNGGCSGKETKEAFHVTNNKLPTQ